MKKFKLLALILALILVVTAVLGACAPSSNPDDEDNNPDSTQKPDDNGNNGNGNGSNNGNKDDVEDSKVYQFADDYVDSKVGQYFEDLGYVDRTLPETKDGGLERYPQYGVNYAKLYGLNLSNAQDKAQFFKEAQQIHDENMVYLSTKNENMTGDCNNYDSMDKNGYFYLNGEHVKDYNGNDLKLFKHTAAEGMYYGNLSDAEKAIQRKVTITPRVANYDNYITGLYAPAGEIVKIEVTQDDLDACGGSFYIYIGQMLLSGKDNNIWVSTDSEGEIKSVGNGNNLTRMPIIATKFQITQTVTYVGSFFGGPIYIGKPLTTNTFSTTISGGVPYSNFILGLTTEEEFNKYKDSTAPYFDLEVWDDGVRFSGPKKYAEPFSYEDLKKSAVLWDQISRVSNVIRCSSDQRVGIEFMFDPFVAAGAAVAFGGNNSVNCPDGWMSDVLDYNVFTTRGSWGNIHEYNHHYQEFGLTERSEVTNNATSLVEYALFTNISAGRTLDKSSTAGEGWNRFTDARGALKETLSLSQSGSPNTTLSSYADLLHAFGPAFMLEVMSGDSVGTDKWFASLCNTMQYDFTYYFEDILHVTVSDSVKADVQAKNYPVFVPVATTLQVGRVFTVDGVSYNSNTMRPFVVDDSTSFEFDLLNSIVAPSNFTVTIKEVTKPANGILFGNNGTYNYTFGSAATSGVFYVKLGIKENSGAFEVDDVVLALNFQKSSNAQNFTSDYFFGREYSQSTLLNPAVIGSQYTAHSSNYGLGNLFDSNEDSFIHSTDGVAINESNQFEMLVDLNQKVVVNSLTMLGRKGGAGYIRTPITFKLYGGLSKDNLTEIGSWENNQLVSLRDGDELARDQYVTFNPVEIRYYKLVVTKCNQGGAICFAELILGGDFATFTNAKVFSAKYDGITYKGGWSKDAKGTFGYHMSVTSAKASMEIKFTGKQFALYSFYSGKEISFRISVDGGAYKRITVSGSNGSAMLAYLSAELDEGEHTVIIKNFDSISFNVDSIAIR